MNDKVEEVVPEVPQADVYNAGLEGIATKFQAVVDSNPNISSDAKNKAAELISEAVNAARQVQSVNIPTKVLDETDVINDDT